MLLPVVSRRRPGPPGGRLRDEGSVQRAIYVSKPEELQPFDPSFEQVYLGGEFCQWQLPSARDLHSTLELSEKHGVGFTLVTPFLSDTGVSRARKLLDMLDEGSEVVFNDWGLLPSITERRLEPVLGRLLVKVRRDPRIGAADLANEDMAAYLRSSNLSQPTFLAFLKSHGIGRAELDNVQQGWDLDLPPEIRTSLYYPFVHASVTRRCSLLHGDAGAAGGRMDGSCVKHCKHVVYRSSIPVHVAGGEERSDQYLHGAALYFENRDIPEPSQLESWGTDRMVHMPDRLAGASRSETDAA
jgi:hypothetical protein